MEICKATVSYQKKFVNKKAPELALDISEKVHFLSKKEAEDWVKSISLLSKDNLFDFKIIEYKESA